MKTKTIQPTQVTNYNRTDTELETFWIFSIMVAGKPSEWAARVVAKFLKNRKHMTPFEYIASMGHGLRNTLVANRVGQYNRISLALEQSLKLNLRTCTVRDLESIYGVGAKTARFFLLHTRKNVECAVLDTHILSWMREFGINTPKATPSGKKYADLEAIALRLMKAEFPGMSIADADLLIWSMMSGRVSDEESFDMTHPFESRVGVDD